MWHFAWLLGLSLAAIFAVVNAMWLEIRSDRALTEGNWQDAEDGTSPKKE